MNFVGSPVYLNVFGNLFKSLIQVWCQRVYLKYSNPRLHVKGLSIWDLRTMTMIPIIWITTWIIKRSMVTLLNSSGASFLPVHPVEILILVPPISYRILCFRTLLLFVSTKNPFLHFQKGIQLAKHTGKRLRKYNEQQIIEIIHSDANRKLAHSSISII